MGPTKLLFVEVNAIALEMPTDVLRGDRAEIGVSESTDPMAVSHTCCFEKRRFDAGLRSRRFADKVCQL